MMQQQKKWMFALLAAGLVFAGNITVHTGWSASHLESERAKITEEQQKALDQLIQSLEVLRSNPESMKIVEEWFENELKKSQEELSEIDQEIAALQKQLEELAAKKEELQKKLTTLQSGQRLITRLSGKTPPDVAPVEADDAAEDKTETTKETGSDAENLFTKTVYPIFEANCIVCHGKEDPAGNLVLLSRADIAKGGAVGRVIVPGDAENSVLYRMITHKAEPFMPLGADQLAKEEIEKIAAWIRAEK